jgi:hypothetical protein
MRTAQASAQADDDDSKPRIEMWRERLAGYRPKWVEKHGPEDSWVTPCPYVDTTCAWCDWDGSAQSTMRPPSACFFT